MSFFCGKHPRWSPGQAFRGPVCSQSYTQVWGGAHGSLWKCLAASESRTASLDLHCPLGGWQWPSGHT